MNFEKMILGLTITVLVLLITILLIFNIVVAEDKSGFTELYFIDELPNTIKMNGRYPFSFAVHNLENKRMTYNYAVYLQSKKIDQGYISLDHDQTSVIHQTFSVNNFGSALGGLENVSILVSVRLLNKGQEIHFWVDLE